MSESQAPSVETDAPRPIRMCDSCGQVDDHPRHVVGYGPGDAETAAEVGAIAIAAAPPEHVAEIIRQVQDTTTTMKHMDCCRADGCPDGTCNAVTSGAENLRGYALVEHLVTIPAPQPRTKPTED